MQPEMNKAFVTPPLMYRLGLEVPSILSYGQFSL
jgi:hypothetical protein